MALRPKLPAKKLEFKPLSKRELKKLTSSLGESFNEVKQQEEDKWKPKTEKVGTCHCTGSIVLVTTFTKKFDPRMGPMIIGPGSRSQFHRVQHEECFCERCGLVYNVEVLRKKRKV